MKITYVFVSGNPDWAMNALVWRRDFAENSTFPALQQQFAAAFLLFNLRLN
jgi:hypothetical protein